MEGWLGYLGNGCGGVCGVFLSGSGRVSFIFDKRGLEEGRCYGRNGRTFPSWKTILCSAGGSVWSKTLIFLYGLGPIVSVATIVMKNCTKLRGN